MPVSLRHAKLRATFEGIKDERDDYMVVHFRGIQYGSIYERFSKAQSVLHWEDQIVDAAKFGPQCPQPQVDVGHLLRLPAEVGGPPQEEDEFKCLNLNVTCPQGYDAIDASIPVILWIHGGSQVVTFASASAPVCDPSLLVSQSVETGKPIIFVTFNYRLNIFAFGDGLSDFNLALQDQRLALDWVVQNISGFGGNPENITLAGESAGAVYTHAHLLTNAPVQRGILASGSLYLSPPLPRDIGAALIGKLAKVVNDAEHCSLRDASVEALLNALSECHISSMWIQTDASLAEWEDRVEDVQSLMIGDVEYESVLWRNGIESMTSNEISECFESDDEHGEYLKKLYNIDRSRPTSSKLGALDFLNDARFALPVDSIARRWRFGEKQVYQYVMDQANPWQASSRAHHAVDLILLFGGIDFSFNTAAVEAGNKFRQSWILFANGDRPWSTNQPYAFGPHGKCGVLEEAEYSDRRRTRCYAYLRQMSALKFNPIFGRLAAGRISLHN